MFMILVRFGVRGVIAVVAGACAVVVNGAVVEGVEELKFSSIDIHDDVHDIGSFRSPRSHRRCSRCLCGRSQWSRGGGR